MSERLADLEIEERDGVLLASMLGEVDSSNVHALRLALTERLANASLGVVLDLSRVGYIDSSGVKLLFDLGSSLVVRRQGMRLVLPAGAPTRRVLELCDVGQVAPIEDSVDVALRALTEPAG